MGAHAHSWHGPCCLGLWLSHECQLHIHLPKLSLLSAFRCCVFPRNRAFSLAHSSEQNLGICGRLSGTRSAAVRVGAVAPGACGAGFLQAAAGQLPWSSRSLLFSASSITPMLRCQVTDRWHSALRTRAFSHWQPTNILHLWLLCSCCLSGDPRLISLGWKYIDVGNQHGEWGSLSPPFPYVWSRICNTQGNRAWKSSALRRCLFCLRNGGSSFCCCQLGARASAVKP